MPALEGSCKFLEESPILELMQRPLKLLLSLCGLEVLLCIMLFNVLQKSRMIKR